MTRVKLAGLIAFAAAVVSAVVLALTSLVELRWRPGEHQAAFT